MVHMAKAVEQGIPIGIYLKTHSELLVRAQIDRGGPTKLAIAAPAMTAVRFRREVGGERS